MDSSYDGLLAIILASPLTVPLDFSPGAPNVLLMRFQQAVNLLRYASDHSRYTSSQYFSIFFTLLAHFLSQLSYTGIHQYTHECIALS